MNMFDHKINDFCFLGIIFRHESNFKKLSLEQHRLTTWYHLTDNDIIKF